jgi:hypothetical protein
MVNRHNRGAGMSHRQWLPAGDEHVEIADARNPCGVCSIDPAD